jgi:uncharacterized protein YjbI with pentapeptide repeats
MNEVKPARAAVRPRVVSPATGETVLLEDLVTDKWTCALVGGPGMGKTTALAHLAAVRPGVFAFEGPVDGAEAFTMAPWGRDEILEYAMVRHPAACKSVMRRVLDAPDLAIAGGVPELIVMAVDEMGADEAVTDVRQAMRACLRRDLPGWQPLTRLALERELKRRTAPPNGADALRHAVVRRLLAAEHVADGLRRHAECRWLAYQFSSGLIDETVRIVGRDPAVLADLRARLLAPTSGHPTIASLLHAARCGWRPDQDRTWFLERARLTSAEWPRLRCRRLVANEADLRDAEMSDAVIESITAIGADFSRVDLHCAKLGHAQFQGATLEDADLSFAQLRGGNFFEAHAAGANFENTLLRDARFTRADLSNGRFARSELRGACIAEACIDDADFSGANLEGALLIGLPLNRATLLGARLNRAKLNGARLADVEWPGAQLAVAALENADLTDAILVRSNLRGALLRHARLASVDLEGADLRDADLTGASFHLGTSRSGMLFKGPSEGTRTGFYTDEYYEQSFKRPEEIRAANLRGADLRGAKIENVDFYLVDLRDALYTPEQEAHFRKCRAILDVRTHGLE